MAGLFKRPRAQSRNPETRRDAVMHDTPDQLGAPLADFARNDADPGVRRAALERVADLALATERAHEDDDAGVRKAATRLQAGLLAGTHPQAPPLDERLQALAGIEDQALLEHLACDGDAVRLREAALQRTTRPSLRMQRLLEDPDADLRLRLLAAINDIPTLQKICDKTRRRDRQLHRGAQGRLEMLQVAAGDRNAIRTVAERLCETLEKTEARHNGEAAVATADAEFEPLRDKVDAALATRYDNARKACLAAARPQEAVASKATWVARKLPRMDEPEHPSAEVASPPASIRKLEAENRFKADVAATIAAPAPGTEKAAPPPPAPAAPPGPDDKALATMLEKLERALEAGNLAAAGGAMRDIGTHEASLPRKLRSRWHRARERFHELKRWEQWSAQRQRRQLCVDARAMRTSTLPPEAIANRIAELRRAWHRLDKLEPAKARQSEASKALQQRFHRLCERALEPTRVWFAKRDAAWNQAIQRVEALLNDDLPDNDDSRGLVKRRRALVDAKRNLDKVAPKARGRLAKRISATISRLDEPLDAHLDKVAIKRDLLIKRATDLGRLDEREQATAARQLQQEWTALGPGRRGRDRKQWQAFREVVDPIFEARKRQHEARVEARQARAEEARALLAELEDNRADDDLAALRARLGEARLRWQALNVRERSLQQRYQAACNALDARAKAIEAQARRDNWHRWLEQLTAGKPDETVPAPLRKAAGKAQPGDTQAMRKVLVRMEILAGVDGPEDDADLRLQLKLERLQGSLGQGQGDDTEPDLEALVAEWIRNGGLQYDDNNLQQRFRAAVDAILA